MAAHFIRMLLAKTFHRVVEMVWQLLLIRMSLATFSFSHAVEVAWQFIFSVCPQHSIAHECKGRFNINVKNLYSFFCTSQFCIPSPSLGSDIKKAESL